MNNDTAVSKIFAYLAKHGETKREVLMRVARTKSINSFERMIGELRETQGVYTVIAGKAISYELNTNTEYTFGLEPTAEDDKARYQAHYAGVAI